MNRQTLTYEDILKLVKLRAPYLDFDSTDTWFTDEFVLEIIQEVEQAMLNYLGLCSIPYELRYVWADIVVDALKYYNQLFKDNSGDTSVEPNIPVEAISIIRVGDTQISLGGQGGTSESSSNRNAHKPDLDGFLMNYTAQMNNFKRVKWGKYSGRHRSCC